ncbi:hypothetical protein A3758_15755 [Oleiphilus sp. HI0118]|uniref:DUF1285 domain-containing protein n=1 Tax=Oleiphilus sp. HI0080 TaxID=1822255 RepID=UPI0007C3A8ED|nr:DUF1285 domain-containing protein [Oleiphilus sp. HI0080]KZY98993.1 hypothetical protein A3744_30870 [Oleiphilus sp. HI0073]KZZ41772.1 hypothetical protein A3758_15755 [Oleiphilus sp. HI0118]KZZ54192.1 hypothetical protein A3760_33220 [Oleiphilus sp. HI0122]KZZ82186.1 hypothetical protein A3767_24345 [Oleiphilus sp. HI0133]
MTTGKQLPNFSQELLELLKYEDQTPPVEQWQPQRKGEVEITIKRDGSWWFQDEPMTRESTVQLFSKILLKEKDQYFLVTPVEKMRLQVELLPFVVRMMSKQGDGDGQRIIFSTNVGDTFEVSEQHPIRMIKSDDGDCLPVVRVRRNLEALVSRQVYYELAEFIQECPDKAGHFGLWSCGRFFLMDEDGH